MRVEYLHQLVEPSSWGQLDVHHRRASCSLRTHVARKRNVITGWCHPGIDRSTSHAHMRYRSPSLAYPRSTS